MPMRSTPLIVIASTSPVIADRVAASLRRDGNVVYVTHSVGGCLRVATSVAPDVVVLDDGLPKRLEKLLQAHPASARAQILHLSQIPSAPLAAHPVLHAAA